MKKLLILIAALCAAPTVANANGDAGKCFDKASLSYVDCDSGPSGMFFRLGGAYTVWEEDFDVAGIPGDGEIDNDVIGIIDFGFFPTPEISITATVTTPTLVNAKADNLTGFANGVSLGKSYASLSALSVQYHFPTTLFGTRPYAGVGVVGAFFFNDKDAALTNVEFDNSVGAILHVGTNGAIDEDWGYFVDIKRFFVTTEVHAAGGVSADVALDPWAFHTGISYRW